MAIAAALVAGLVIFALVRRGDARGPAKAPVAASAAVKRAPPPVRASLRPRASIAGHVLDLEGKPVNGAQVCAWATPGGKQLSTKETHVPRCTTSDREGSYGLGDLFPATPLVVSASAKGFAPVGFRPAEGPAEIRLGDGERRTGVDLQFTRIGVELKGSVNDVTGGAVARAFVVSGGGPDRSVATSDNKGDFTMWVEPGQVRVEATASGYSPGYAYGPAPDHFFKIQLTPGATLVGRTVMAGEGTPVAGVFVEGIQVEGGWSRASTRTDDDGHFQIEGLSPGRYRVEATSEGREGYSKSSVTLSIGETSQEIVVQMDPAYVVRARVVEKGTGAPCKSGHVTITDTNQSEYSEANIEPDGYARMASVIPGTYKVDVHCEGHVDRDDFPKLIITNRDAPPLTWEVETGAVVRVEVVDDHGKAVTKASVSLFSTKPNGGGAWADQAEPDGVFKLAGVKKGEYTLAVRTPEGARASSQVIASLDREERVKVEIASVGVIDGVVEDASHRPVGNVQVMAQGAGHAYARSLDDGTFVLTGLPPGDYDVRAGDNVGRRRFEPAAEPANPASATKVTLRGSEHAKVRLTVEAREGTISGRVVDASDKPVTDAFVDGSASSEGGPPRYNDPSHPAVLTDTDGRFTLEGLGTGEYTIRASRRGGGEVNVENVKVGSREVVLKLDSGGSIAGTLTQRGAPVERFTLTVTESKSSFTRSELFFHAGGAFSLSDLPAGNYKVVAETPTARASQELVLASGEQKTGVSLTMTVRGSVDGILVSLENGAPIAGATINLNGQSDAAIYGGDGSSNVSGPDGRFHLGNVLAGSWSLLVYSSEPGVEAVSIPVTVAEGAAADVGSIRLPRSRVGPGESRGNLGFYAGQGDGPITVSYATPPASDAGLVAGDVITSVDGYDVGGKDRYMYPTLIAVPSGRSVTIGVARGATMSITAQ